jgi:arginyl-tRNA synthetase
MNPIQNLRENIKALIMNALDKSRQEGLINFQEIPEFVIEVPRDSGHGDFATNVAMLMARPARLAPRKIAEILCAYMTPAGRLIR